ncbi:MAG TPA: quinolinate synthase NadA [Coriobacteriia bacterium]|nr:quinolinate synthase NadA [Coriobacteriia bacterium]
MPDAAARNAELAVEIRRLAAERNAVVLAHNYQRADVQDVADFVGDSLGLSRQAAETDANVIVFAGVHFMAETAKILAPGKTVLLPELRAGCPMADMLTGDQLRAWKAAHPGVPVVTYVNSSADVKAESDVCVTSANAVAVVRALGADRILFAPDRNLGSWVARSLPGTEVILWDGWCPTHDEVTVAQVQAARAEHPGAKLMAHPECRPDVVDLADAVLSTSQMLAYAAEDDADEFVVVTESGLMHALAKAAPEKHLFELAPRMLCPNMKLTTLAKVHAALVEMQYEVVVEPEIAARAATAVERMVAIG